MMIARCTAHLRPVSISALNTLSNMPIAPTCRVNDMFYVPQISNNYYTFIHRTHKSLDHNYQGIATGSKKVLAISEEMMMLKKRNRQKNVEA